MVAPKNLLTGNESIDDLSNILCDITNEESSAFDKKLTNQDVANALWILLDEVQSLNYLKSHTHKTKTIDVIEG